MQVQKQLSVGVGGLAGSTILLLTVPWCLSVFAGRVSLDADGKGLYARSTRAHAQRLDAGASEGAYARLTQTRCRAHTHMHHVPGAAMHGIARARDPRPVGP